MSSLGHGSGRCVFGGMSRQRKRSGGRGREEGRNRRLEEEKRCVAELKEKNQQLEQELEALQGKSIGCSKKGELSS